MSAQLFALTAIESINVVPDSGLRLFAVLVKLDRDMLLIIANNRTVLAAMPHQPRFPETGLM